MSRALGWGTHSSFQMNTGMITMNINWNFFAMSLKREIVSISAYVVFGMRSSSNQIKQLKSVLLALFNTPDLDTTKTSLQFNWHYKYQVTERSRGGQQPAPLTPAPNTPFALPASLGHSLQGRVQAVGVVADVAVITQEESPWICGFPTGFTHCALQAPPTFAEYHFSNLKNAGWELVENGSVKCDQCTN